MSKQKIAPPDPTKLFEEHGAEVTEAVARFLHQFCSERQISTEECAFGLALVCCNMRVDFPPDLGGTPKFDEIAGFAQDYFKKHTQG